tara:strand:- start:689 stop:1381 length:693 start_codon:yes stop_codon:yes gene_type:complete
MTGWVSPEYKGGPQDKWMFREVLGIPFFRFDLGYSNTDKMEEIYKVLKALSYRFNDTNEIWDGVKLDGQGGSDLYNNPDLAYLFDWMQDCMAEVCDRMGIPNKMVCNAAWANLNKKGDWFYDHTHSNCFMSSNYFASGDATSSTKWYYPNPYYDKTNIWPFDSKDYDDKFNLTHEEPTVPGRFIVFPPTIRHRATPNQKHDARITVAANWFPTGMINSSGVSHLNVNVVQ